MLSRVYGDFVTRSDGGHFLRKKKQLEQRIHKGSEVSAAEDPKGGTLGTRLKPLGSKPAPPANKDLEGFLVSVERDVLNMVLDEGEELKRREKRRNSRNLLTTKFFDLRKKLMNDESLVVVPMDKTNAF